MIANIAHIGYIVTRSDLPSQTNTGLKMSFLDLSTIRTKLHSQAVKYSLRAIHVFLQKLYVYFIYSSHLSKSIACLCIIFVLCIERFAPSIDGKGILYSVTTSVFASSIYQLLVFEIPKVHKLRSLYRYINNIIANIIFNIDSYNVAVLGNEVLRNTDLGHEYKFGFQYDRSTIEELCKNINPNSCFVYIKGSQIVRFKNYCIMSEHFTKEISKLVKEVISFNDIISIDILALAALIKDCANESINMHGATLGNSDISFASHAIAELCDYRLALAAVWRNKYQNHLASESRWIAERLGVTY